MNKITYLDYNLFLCNIKFVLDKLKGMCYDEVA